MRKIKRYIAYVVLLVLLVLFVSQLNIEQLKKVADDAREMVSSIFDLSDIANEEDTTDSDNGSRTASVTATVSSGLEEVDLVRVVDGDTIIINTAGEDMSVRLIGVDTPESVNPDENKNNEYGSMASEYTKELLADVRTLYLQYDVTKTDKYGRILAYVWLNNNINTLSQSDICDNMLNAILVENGYAYDKVYMPNKEYSDVFAELRETAENSGTGLWQYPEFAELWN